MKTLIFAVSLGTFALGIVGPTSRVNAQSMRDNFPPSEVCDYGVFVLGDEESFTFEDMILEGNRVTDWNAFGPTTAYGYLGIKPSLRNGYRIPSDQNERIEAYLSAGSRCGWGFVLPASDLNIDAIVLPRGRTDQELREIRRIFLRATDKSFGTALVRLTGQFDIYNNTFEPYFLIDTIEIVDAFDD